MLLGDFLKGFENGVDVLLGLIETHGFGGVLHAKVDIGFVEVVEILLVALKQCLSNIYLLFVFLLHL